MISLTVTLFILLYTAVFAAVTLLQARKRSWITTAIRLGTTLVSAFLAIPLAKSVSGSLTDVVRPMLDSALPQIANDWLVAVPAAEAGVLAFCGMLIAVLLYLPCFIIFRVIFGIATMICEREMPILSREEDKKLAISLPIAGAHALLITIVTLIPLCCLLTMGAHIIRTAEQSPSMQSVITTPFEGTDISLDSIATDVEKNPCTAVVHYTLGKPVFYLLTTDTLDKTTTHGESVRLNMERELCGIIATIGDAVDAGKAFSSEEFSQQDKEILFEAADTLFETKWVSLVATDTLAYAAERWQEGDDFLGIARPTMSDVIDPTFSCVLQLLASETPQTLSEDIHVILDVLCDLRLKGFLNAETVFYEDLIRSLGRDGFLTSLLARLDQNERMHLLVDEIRTMSVRLVGSMLGVDQLQSGQYDALMDDVASSLNDVLQKPAEERDEIIKQAINQNFDTHGFNVPEDVALEVSDKVINELGADGEITKAELIDFLSNYASKNDASSTENGNGNATEDVTLPDDLLDDILGGLTDETQVP